jgi:hypothetical protein
MKELSKEQLKEQALMAMRQAKMSPYESAIEILLAEGFSRVPGGNLVKRVEKETIVWPAQVPTKTIHQIFQEISNGKVGSWQKLYRYFGLIKNEKVICPIIGRGIFTGFACLLHGTENKNTIIKITKGLESISPYIQSTETWDPYNELYIFKETFPL